MTNLNTELQFSPCPYYNKICNIINSSIRFRGFQEIDCWVPHEVYIAMDHSLNLSMVAGVHFVINVDSMLKFDEIEFRQVKTNKLIKKITHVYYNSIGPSLPDLSFSKLTDVAELSRNNLNSFIDKRNVTSGVFLVDAKCRFIYGDFDKIANTWEFVDNTNNTKMYFDIQQLCFTPASGVAVFNGQSAVPVTSGSRVKTFSNVTIPWGGGLNTKPDARPRQGTSIDDTFTREDVGTSTIKTLQEFANSCNHEWKTYEGLNEVFDYCAKCDEKK